TALRQCVNRSSGDAPVSKIIIREGFAQSFSGAHILIRFNNVGTGISIVLPKIVLLTRGATQDWTGGYLQRVETNEYEVVNADPSGTTSQAGPIKLWFYGKPAPVQTTTKPLASGEVMIWTARAAVPGFSGYLIAQASFQNCHGFAFIWDLTTQKKIERYPAIE